MAGGSAAVQGALWGTRVRDWAEVQEGTARPLFERVLERTNVGPGTRFLDVGCGAGLACHLGATRGAEVAGLDATESLLAVARQRVPTADLRVGEMEQLPFEDAAFDVVTGFNSFQYAARPIQALAEAKRVARPGAFVVIAVWGAPEDCQAAAYLAALRPLLPSPPPGAPGPFALSDPNVLRTLATDAGLKPGDPEDVSCPWIYPNLETALRGLLSAGPAVLAIQTSGQERVREATIRALEPFRTASGMYQLENKFRYLAGTA